MQHTRRDWLSMTFPLTRHPKNAWVAAVLAFVFGGPGCFYLGWQFGLLATSISIPIFIWAVDRWVFAAPLLQVTLAVVSAKICSANNAGLALQQQPDPFRPQTLDRPGAAVTGAAARTGKSPVRKTLEFAICLFVVDAFLLNQGIFSGLVAFLAICSIPVAFWSLVRRNRSKFRLHMAQIGIVLAGCLAVLAANGLQNEMADRKAIKLGTACLEFHARNNRYPKDLHELVPTFIPQVPPAKYAFMDSSFSYMVNGAGEPEIWYTVIPPFARRFYHVEKRTWGFLD